MTNHPNARLPSFSDETEDLFRRVLNERTDLVVPIDRDKRRLKQPVTRVSAENIFTWHLDKHSIIEHEIDPTLIKQRVWQRRVGVKDGGRLTEAQIVAQEKRLGVRIPDPWRDVYKNFNGGWVDTLFWGDVNEPRIDDIVPIPKGSHQYLSLEDVAPLRDLLAAEWKEMGYGTLDCSSLDPRLIAIALSGSEAILLDYRENDDPRVCLAYFDKYGEDPLATWETDNFTFWWPTMDVFFRGLYLQRRFI